MISTQASGEFKFEDGDGLAVDCVIYCVEIKSSRRVRTEASRRPPRHRRGACSMAWRCASLTARRSHASDSLFDFHTGRERRRRQGHGGLDADIKTRPAVLSLALYILSSNPTLCDAAWMSTRASGCERGSPPQVYIAGARGRQDRSAPRPLAASTLHIPAPRHCPSSRLTQHPLPLPGPGDRKLPAAPGAPPRRTPSQIPPSHSKPVARQCI